MPVIQLWSSKRRQHIDVGLMPLARTWSMIPARFSSGIAGGP
ncbi:hypothetical protein PC116_g31508 [Phytophthora cactorum]|nr:hypothetical protein PC116_g31508 [Phytophthora cactorum]